MGNRQQSIRMSHSVQFAVCLAFQELTQSKTVCQTSYFFTAWCKLLCPALFLVEKLSRTAKAVSLQTVFSPLTCVISGTSDLWLKHFLFCFLFKNKWAKCFLYLDGFSLYRNSVRSSLCQLLKRQCISSLMKVDHRYAEITIFLLFIMVSMII